MKSKEYKICKRCVMDTSDPAIVFDENGLCNHCSTAIQRLEQEYSDPLSNKKKIDAMISTVKKTGQNKQYDAVIGLSGGIDSSYLAYTLVKDYGLNPLAVHLDNGWNSEQAVANIHKIVTTLNIDLHTHVINWEEFRELQKAFLYASVVDLEMLSDHAIVVVIDKLAREKKIKYFIIGSNYQTESILPKSWYYWDKKDSLNIRDIYSKYGSNLKIKTFPFLSFFEYVLIARRYGRYLTPLSYMDYNKDKAKEILKSELGWVDYGAKHHESFITKFYQTYILPEKFNIDKRRAHLSSLICTKQISRDEALNILEQPLLSDREIRESVEYFCKKMEISSSEFKKIMSLPRKEHAEFKLHRHKRDVLFSFINKLRNKNK